MQAAVVGAEGGGDAELRRVIQTSVVHAHLRLRIKRGHLVAKSTSFRAVCTFKIGGAYKMQLG